MERLPFHLQTSSLIAADSFRCERAKGIFSNIFSKMWDQKIASTKMAVNVKTTAAVQRAEDESPKEREPSWAFKRFVAFCLYGCQVIPNPKDCLAHFQLVVNSRAQRLPTGLPSAKRS